MKVLIPFIRLFSRQWLMMSVGLLLTIITLMAGIGLLSLSGWFLSATAVAGLTIVTAQSFNFFTPAGGVRFLSIARTASRYGERLATHEATFKLLTELRVWAWCKLLPLSAKNLQGLRRGDMLNRLVADIDTLDHLYLRLLTPMAASLLMTGLLYLFLAWFDAKLALSLCLFLVAVWLVMPLLFYRLGHAPSRTMLETKRHYRVQLLDMLQGQAELSLFGANNRFRQKLNDAEIALFRSQSAMANITALSQAMLILSTGSALIMMLYLAAQGVGDAVPPGPMFALMVFATMACVEMMMPIAGAFQHLSGCVLAATRINEITEQKADIQFAVDTGLRAKSGALQIEGIHFGYRDDQNVLQGLSLEIKAGQKVALLGPTGCGKSSLLTLITREWQAQQGHIKLDGHALSEYSERGLRDAITVISQRIYLFAGTLRENLVLALPVIEGEKRTAHDARLIDVLQRVGLGALLTGDKPLDMWIGEGGRQLSGGEQRRIGVARALLRDAPLLLLDEPTEGLDKRTEREILSLLFEFAQDKTLLMISHRLTAMAKMDQIHLLGQGKIIASGTHQSLIEDCVEYQALYQRLA
ncbi:MULTISPECIES: cysteine/glutathione ABC transporter ATP-binding protein/permease CydC [unclassified Shewanella]|uniref:heme ABC transporter ATP-binding protein/permease CydC n=1 Tax=Shewanella TaxID=22 RepID=UPI001B47FE7F|nr:MULTISPECIES: cysteine/glutathione ABC transporter ATP-binding protein/permease CydC [unclassified Shewanella]MBP6520859.1 cysteine/glutathione ABC transporter ATP-binding protein/permease CydC [Shewanella sp.]MCU8012781.1 cysteine/glutathione ABC transporter ATP-binding protein/permease CydC [Shewanella sp. SM74]MCU8020813.1 cysteine/glutathione ABC transporter ATP-binding protein/permease CydC [Shewanella sp. SM78]MCU8042305.1 cysteine/glutathione ABC transporter ATP-binding protein/permea